MQRYGNIELLLAHKAYLGNSNIWLLSNLHQCPHPCSCACSFAALLCSKVHRDKRWLIQSSPPGNQQLLLPGKDRMQHTQKTTSLWRGLVTVNLETVNRLLERNARLRAPLCRPVFAQTLSQDLYMSCISPYAVLIHGRVSWLCLRSR